MTARSVILAVCLACISARGAAVVVVKVAAYDNAGLHGCRACCGKWAKYNRTADGHRPKVGVTCATWRWPFGTRLQIGDLGVFVVQDRPKRRSGAIEIFMDTHKKAKRFGVRALRVEVIK